jgi:hypothetical protein
MFLPLELRKGEELRVTVILAPETYGLLQSALIVSITYDGNLVNLMVPITSFHIANDYDLEPVYFTNVNVGSAVTD